MFSEESAVETDGSGNSEHDSSDSEREPRHTHKKKLIQHMLLGEVKSLKRCCKS